MTVNSPLITATALDMASTYKFPSSTDTTSTKQEKTELSSTPNLDAMFTKQEKLSVSPTFDIVNNWLGFLMITKNYTELNAFFDYNHNNFFAKGRSYCDSNLTDIKTTEVVNAVEDNKLLELYIKKIDQDQAELRIDIRASEERTAKKIESTESRMDVRLNRIEALLTQNARDVNEKFDKIDAKFDSLKTEAGNALKWNVGISTATMIGIGAMVITVVVTFMQIIKVI